MVCQGVRKTTGLIYYSFYGRCCGIRLSLFAGLTGISRELRNVRLALLLMQVFLMLRS